MGVGGEEQGNEVVVVSLFMHTHTSTSISPTCRCPKYAAVMSRSLRKIAAPTSSGDTTGGWPDGLASSSPAARPPSSSSPSPPPPLLLLPLPPKDSANPTPEKCVVEPFWWCATTLKGCRAASRATVGSERLWLWLGVGGQRTGDGVV